MIEQTGTDTPSEAPTEALPPAPPPELPLAFDQMGLLPEVLEAVTAMGYAIPTEVQRISYPKIMAGRDLLVQSRTGSGKTAAFGIPMAQGLLDPLIGEVQALALCPTRELALQVASECNKLGERRGLTVVPIYGGAPMGKQVDGLRGGAQIVAGTPGRVLDHLRRGTLKLDALRLLVLDEADEMLSMGFYEEISEILKHCPTNRQTLLFSATIPADIERIATKYQRDPEKIALSTGYVGVQQIQHLYYMVSGMGRSRDLIRIFEIEKPEAAIIFCNTREDTNFVAEAMRRAGYDAEAISSDLSQSDRERVMGRMRDKNLKYLVATDIAARGIDISDLSHVFNYTFPESPEVYVHRTGRTGRAGKSGIAISLISPRELGNFYYLKLTYKIRPEERILPSEEEAATKRDDARAEAIARLVARAAPVGDDWVAMARRVLGAEGAENTVSLLLKHYIDGPQPEVTPATDAQPAVGEGPTGEPGAEPSAEARSERPVRARREREERGGRGGRESRGRAGGREGGREGREGRPSRRDEGPKRAPRSDLAAMTKSPAEAAPPVEVAAPAPVASPPAAPSPAAARAEARREERGAAREGRRRGRSDGKRSEGQRSEGSSSTPAPGSKRPGPNEVIDAPAGRDFWEVWAEDRTTSEAASPPSTSMESTSSETVDDDGGDGGERETRAARDGSVRLYLSLGRRDKIGPTEIEALLREHALPYRRLFVRHSHTYVLVEESDADRVIGALHGRKNGERELLCERSRR